MRRNAWVERLDIGMGYDELALWVGGKGGTIWLFIIVDKF
jgi:hypothetical protein